MTSAPGLCARHGAPATHRCDGCERLLCEACFEVGHRLLFCKLCGERALPLSDQGVRSAPELVRARRRREPYSWRDALRYPFRGLGGNVFWGTMIVALLIGFLMSAGSILLMLNGAILTLVLLYLAPALSFAIVASTTRGDDELPSWPDWTTPGRFAELMALLVLVLMAVLPAAILVWQTGCEAGLLEGDSKCRLLLAAGLVVGSFLFVPAFAGTASVGNPWSAIRWDLHLKTLIATPEDSIRLALLLSGLYLLGSLADGALQAVPLLGWLLRVGIHVYAWFLGMHLIGLFARRHEDLLDSIYLD